MSTAGGDAVDELWAVLFFQGESGIGLEAAAAAGFVGAMGAYEARCRRCFEPNPALAQEKKDGPQLIARNRAVSAGGSS